MHPLTAGRPPALREFIERFDPGKQSVYRDQSLFHVHAIRRHFIANSFGVARFEVSNLHL